MNLYTRYYIILELSAQQLLVISLGNLFSEYLEEGKRVHVDVIVVAEDISSLVVLEP